MADELEVTVEEEPETPVSLEDQVAQLLAENKRLKRAVDKSASQAADYKKQLNARLSEQEQLEAARAESMAELAELKKEKAIDNAATTYIALGYSPERAKQAAEAFLNGDVEEFSSIQRDFLTEKEKAFRETLMKGMPSPQAGGEKESGDSPMTMEEFNAHKADPNWINSNWGRVQAMLQKKG